MFVTIKDLGLLSTNAYLWFEDPRHALLIDPGAEEERIISCVTSHDLTVEKILLTHSHFDHIGAAEALRGKWNVPVLVHENGEKILADPELNLSAQMRCPFTLHDVSTFRDGDKIFAGRACLQVMHTPGHTSDSVVFYDTANGVAFTGDTIFQGSYGTVHFPTGDAVRMRQSLADVLALPPETLLLPGHGAETTVREEQENYQ